jgi:hypothetical protein
MNTGTMVPLTKYKDWKNNVYAGINGWYDDFYQNPYFEVDHSRRTTNQADFLGNVEMSLQPTKWLNLLTRVGLTNKNYRDQSNTLPILYCESQ